MKQPSARTENDRRVCPRCGTRLGETATRCVVCGAELRPGSAPRRSRRSFDVTLSLPLAVLLLAVFSLLSAGLTFATVRFTGLGARAEPTGTETPTPTITPTPSPTSTPTLEPTPTLHPPSEHKIVSGDTCNGLAYVYQVSVRSILELNPGLACEALSIGTVVLVPYPTPTLMPSPTATLPPAQATEAACQKMTYIIQPQDTLYDIALSYNVDPQAIKEYNGMTADTVYSGQTIVIPLCRRMPTPGPTPTPTPPPPYPAPSLLLPLDGAPFTLADDAIALQWASVGALRENEYYEVTVLDVTEGSGSVRLVDYVKDTKFVVPEAFRPGEALPHVMRWWVTTVRQVDTDAGGEPIFDSAGATSVTRDFTWSGAAPATTPSP